jgi:hypothetical protein
MPSKQVSTQVLVPFTRQPTGHITVVAKLTRRSALFVVDTGAGGTVIHNGVLNRYKLELTGRIRKSAGMGVSGVQLTAVASHDLHLGLVDLSEIKLHALDLSHVIEGFAKANVPRIVGVLGADVLHRRHAIIDYQRQCIVLVA